MNSLSLTGSDVKNQRESNDFYPTPAYATLALLDREEFTGSIWEPACGDGAISKLLPPVRTMSSDLIDRGYGENGIDFLKTVRHVNNIVTNPPYSLAEEFVKHSLLCADQKVAMLLKLNFLEGQRRYKELFSYTPLKQVYVFSKRISFDNGDEKSSGGGCLRMPGMCGSRATTGHLNLGGSEGWK